MKLRYSKEECLDRESIRAYTVENGGLTRCKLDSWGMDIPVFDESIEQINERAVKLTNLVSEEI